ncbi:SWIM zinc finger family protein [Paenibacillus guangzhouensis]|uniref:SWIM zinc finger family protein n=1 Tax=Paenibacillus guangzhouensis TaxID=1473112 RepID=UPI001266BE1E|nr:SWIM zinc finger family protein [Paenibacillus guangzhouensis]
MQVIHPIPDAEWNELLAYIGEHVQDVTLKRGFQYYKQNRIRSIAMPQSHQIEADVKGKEIYHVKVNLKDLSASRCSCPMRRNCRHLIAALLWYADRQGRSTHQIINAKILWELKGKRSANLPRKPVPAAVEPLEQRKIEADIRTMNVSEWHALWNDYVTPFASVIRHEVYLKSNLTAMNAMNPKLPPPLDRIYLLNAYIYLLGKITQSSGPSEYGAGYKTRLAREDAMDMIHSLLGQGISLTKEDKRARMRIMETLEAVRQLIRSHPQNEIMIQIYHQLWQDWLRPNMSDTRPYIEELSALNASIQANSGRSQPYPWLYFKTFMLFYLARDQEAWEMLREMSRTVFLATSHLTPFFEPLYEAKDWPRLTSWLVATGPMLRKYHNEQFQSQYLDYWNGMLGQSPDSEPLLFETLAKMLPFSQTYYQETLLAYGKWEQWIDYQLTTGGEPLEFRATTLAPIEKNAPEALLPFYHQAVERYVQQKNRDSYKLAVKLLKRLFRMYKKMKQEERWMLFLEGFIARHSRLRALQQELQKGNLLL